MTTKPSPDAIKMLKSLKEHFNQAFDANKYSAVFRREFSHMFKIDRAFQISIYGSNDAYILGLGIIDCWDFERNVELIENKINEKVRKKEERLQWFENLIPLVEKDKIKGKVDNVFVELFYQTLEEVRKWRKSEEDSYAYLPLVVDHLKGTTASDYKTIKQDLSDRIKWGKQHNVSDELYQQFCEWIELPSTKKQYGKRRWSAMKKKLALRG